MSFFLFEALYCHQKVVFLQGHLMAHTGERLFSCTKCQKVIYHMCWFEQTCQASEKQHLLAPNVKNYHPIDYQASHRIKGICLYQMSKNINPKWIFEKTGQASHRIEGICLDQIHQTFILFIIMNNTRFQNFCITKSAYSDNHYLSCCWL